MAIGENQKFQPVRNFQFRINGSEMVMHGNAAYKKRLGNLFVFQAFSYHFDHFFFSFAQRSDFHLFRALTRSSRFVGQFTEQRCGAGSIQPGFAGVDAFNSLDQHRGRLIFRQYSGGAQPDNFFAYLRIV